MLTVMFWWGALVVDGNNCTNSGAIWSHGLSYPCWVEGADRSPPVPEGSWKVGRALAPVIDGAAAEFEESAACAGEESTDATVKVIIGHVSRVIEALGATESAPCSAEDLRVARGRFIINAKKWCMRMVSKKAKREAHSAKLDKV
jgi:hypothetical protein